MLKDGKILIGKSDKELYLLPNMANRHGLIAGATGTGKTITMKVMAEGFSDMGVPVFFSDVKGDLTGMCTAGAANDALNERLAGLGIDGFDYKAYPTRFWDIFGEQGHPVRVSVSALGPMLLARLLNLTDVQEGVLNIVFKVADDNGLLLIDMKDLRALLQYVGDNREEYTTLYGNVSTASIGAIQRALLQFEQQDGEGIFGEPMLDIKDWIRTDTDGRGYINILSSTRLIQSPLVYSTFLLWMLTELYEKLPEVGDLDKPRMVFFFDEAHYLFTDTPKALVQKIEQIIKLIRSKGVGVYFVTQNPSDVPDSVLAQLSNRVQHALRAYTPSEQKCIKAAAQAFRVNDAFDTEEALSALGKGEALVSLLDEKGIPAIVEKAVILPPQSLMGPSDEGLVSQIIASSEFDLKYREAIDRVSAYEMIKEAADQLAAEQAEAEGQVQEAEAEAPQNATEAAAEESKAKKEKKKQGTAAKFAQQAANNVGSTVARAVSTNLVNSVTGGKTTNAATIAKRAATNALSSVLRSSSKSIIRGLFGNIK